MVTNNLVLIDKRTRYPVAELVESASYQANKERLKHIFTMYGTPRRIESNGGSPINTKKFSELATQERFQQHKERSLI